MNCPRCKGPMIIMEHNVQPSSTQTWFQCTVCSGQRLLSAERPRYVVGSGQSLVSRFRAEGRMRSQGNG
jgi:transposase-like protein